MLLVPTTRHRPSRTLSLVIMHRLPHGVKSTRTRSRLTGALRTSRGSRTASSASRRCTLRAHSLDKCIEFMLLGGVSLAILTCFLFQVRISLLSLNVQNWWGSTVFFACKKDKQKAPVPDTFSCTTAMNSNTVLIRRKCD